MAKSLAVLLIAAAVIVVAAEPECFGQFNWKGVSRDSVRAYCIEQSKVLPRAGGYPIPKCSEDIEDGYILVPRIRGVTGANCLTRYNFKPDGECYLVEQTYTFDADEDIALNISVISALLHDYTPIYRRSDAARYENERGDVMLVSGRRGVGRYNSAMGTYMYSSMPELRVEFSRAEYRKI